MVNSLIAIAAYIALIGGVIFGVKQFEKRSEPKESIELLAKPTQSLALEKPTETPVVSEPATEPNPVIEVPPEATPDFQATFVEDPWSELNSETTEAEAAQTVLDLGEIPSAERDEQSYEETVADDTPEPMADQLPLEFASIEPETPLPQILEIDPEAVAEEHSGAIRSDVISEAEPSEELEPRYQVEEVIIPPTIHDPKRPNSERLENLTQEILAWGQSKDLKHLPKLMQNATSSDAIVRGNVAIALGQIAASHPVRKEIEQAIPVLGKLTQDSNLQVRQFAVQALGAIRSEKVLPYLQQALLSPSGSVMKAANDALQNLKLHYGKTPGMQLAQKMLEKPKSKA